MAASIPLRSERRARASSVNPLFHRTFHVLRYGFALFGLGVAVTVVLLATRPEVRESAVARLIGLLQAPQTLLAVVEDEPMSVAALTGSYAQSEVPLAQSATDAVQVQLDESAPVLQQLPAPLAAPLPPELSQAVTPVAPADPAPLVAAAAPDAPLDVEVAPPVTRAVVLAAHPQELPRAQAKVALWLSKKYKVAAEPLSVLVAEAWEIGQRHRLDWTLILAVMAVESSFNPFAQSSVGAQGLMQVMTRVHSEKYDSAGGDLAAFNPVTNLRVGVEVLLECIERAGSLQGGLKYYVGAANLGSDGGYAKRVLAEQARLKKVAAGRAVS